MEFPLYSILHTPNNHNLRRHSVLRTSNSGFQVLFIGEWFFNKINYYSSIKTVFNLEENLILASL